MAQAKYAGDKPMNPLPPSIWRGVMYAAPFCVTFWAVVLWVVV